MPAEIIAATDGSAINNPHGPIGWAWYVNDQVWSAGGFPKGTNQFAELFAVLALLRATPSDMSLRVLTDSKYTIDCLVNWRPDWRARGWRKQDGSPVGNASLLKEIDAALRSRPGKVTFVKVRGHSGHPMNDAADKRCTAASAAIKSGRAIPRGPGWSPSGVTTRTAPAVPAARPTAVASGGRPSVATRPASALTRQAGSQFAPPPARNQVLEVCRSCGGNIDPFTGECRCSD